MRRRHVLRGLAATALCSLAGLPGHHLASALAGQAGAPSLRPAIPILMFHKVDDQPRYPEDISTTQLTALFDQLWRLGFRPVTISDILTERVDAIVPAGMKPVGITADDAHRSILFSRADARHEQQRNARSFVDILATSARKARVQPRATLFLSRVGDDRYSKEADSYFGKVRALPDALDRLSALPGVELGYHTRTHTRMTNMTPRDVRALLEDQRQDFIRLGVLERVQPILAYPYGIAPTREGVKELARMGFIGAVKAHPGANEGRMIKVPPCEYDGTLLSDPFRLPRVCIGAFTYTSEASLSAMAYTPIDPLDDLAKDVLNSPSPLYVSKG